MTKKTNAPSLNLFFPAVEGGLDKQQFISDIFMPQISRGTSKSNRSGLAKMIYDDDLPKSVVGGLDEKVHKKIIQKRPIGKEKIVSFNADYHQDFEESFSANKERNFYDQQKYNEYVKFMINVGTEELAVMQPFVKLIYRYRQNAGDDWQEIVMPFPSFTTEKEYLPIFTPKFARGDGSGIENITVNRQFPAFGNLLHVTVDINYFFQNLGILTRKQQFPGKNLPGNFTFLKTLALLPQDTEQLVLEYGYSLNTKFTDPTIIPPALQEEIIRRETKRFVIRYMKHSFDIEQNGTVKLSVSYTSQQDFDVLKNKADISLPGSKINISSLSPSGGERTKQYLNAYAAKVKKRDELEEQLRKIKVETEKRRSASVIKGLSQSKSANTKIEAKRTRLVQEVKDLNVEINTLKDKITPLAKPLFVDDMINHMDVFKINFKSTAVDPNKDGQRDFKLDAFLNLVTKDTDGLKDVELSKMTTKFSSEEFRNNLTLDLLNGKTREEKITLVDNLAGTLFNLPKGLNDKGKKFGDTIFFSVRALIASAYRQLDDNEKKVSPYISLGNIDARSLGKDYSINMGDVLVELSYFQKWYYENYTRKGRLIYTFGEFVTDITKIMIPDILQNNGINLFGNTRVGTVQRINYLTTLKPNEKSTKELFKNVYLSNNKDNLRKLASSVNRTSETKTTKNLLSFIHYTLVRNPSNQNTSPYLKRVTAKTNFNEDMDVAQGIPHIKVGADDGLLKNINFVASDFPGMRMALWAQNLTDSAENLLRYYYSTNVQTIGNNIFFKGGFFGIPPNLLGIENDEFDPGISGYYVIQKVSDTLSLGNYTTQLYGSWVTNPRLNQGKTGTAEQEDKLNRVTPIQAKLSIVNYLEELLRLDIATLKKNGLGANFKLIKKPTVDKLPPQNDIYKDIKENLNG